MLHLSLGGETVLTIFHPGYPRDGWVFVHPNPNQQDTPLAGGETEGPFHFVFCFDINGLRS